MRIVFKTSYDADIRLFKHGTQMFWYGLLLALAIVLPFFINSYYVGEFTLMLIWAIAGMGLMLLVGHTGIASLGHSAFLAIGAYSHLIMMEFWGLPFLISMPIAAGWSALFGFLLAWPTTRMHGIYLAIATLAIAILTEDFVIMFEHWTGGVNGKFAPTIDIFGLTFDRYGDVNRLYWLVLVVTTLIVIAYRNILRAPLGRAFAAVRDSEISAQAMGVNVARTKAISFAISCGITGVAGALFAHFNFVITSETFNVFISINLLLMIVIGGVGSIHGAFFGAMLVTFLPTAISFVRDWMSANLGTSSVAIPGTEAAVFGMILILMVIFEPRGIYGRWLKIRTYFELFPFYRRDMFRRQKSYQKTERMR